MLALATSAGTLLAATIAGADSSLPPRAKGALLAWLRSGAYRETYTPEPALRESAVGAHGRYVRTWYGPRLVEDLHAGRPVFRKGAAMVKELYFGGEDVIGWAVMRKLRARSGRGGRGWLFYETADGTNSGAYHGRGLGICAGCHKSGTDFLLTGFRP